MHLTAAFVTHYFVSQVANAVENLTVTSIKLSRAKTRAVKAFLDKYDRGRPMSLCDYAEAKEKELRRQLRGVAEAMRTVYFELLREKLYQTITNSRVTSAFVEEMDNRIVVMP